MNTRTQTGFTLYELLTTMLIVGVILTLGVPNMREFRQNSRMVSTANDLHSSFHLARSEATRAKTNITICASADSTAATPTCGGGFEAGWVVFEDRDGNIVVDNDESVLRSFPAVHESIVINSVGPDGSVVPDDFFSFAATGVGRGTVFGKVPVAKMVLCDERGNVTAAGGKSAARAFVVTPLGRATVLREKAQVAFHGGCP